MAGFAAGERGLTGGQNGIMGIPSPVAFGAKLELAEGKAKAETWYLVGEGEDDPMENRILTSGPMGQALLGKKVGDLVEVKAPMGTIKFTVKKIAY